MIARCYYKSDTSYPRYGGKGITVCDRWRYSFLNFLSDMGEKPEGLTIDRISNTGIYEPSNCRWATVLEQARNKGAYKKREFCKRGHPFDTENTYVNTVPQSWATERRCRACARIYDAARRAKKRATRDSLR